MAKKRKNYVEKMAKKPKNYVEKRDSKEAFVPIDLDTADMSLLAPVRLQAKKNLDNKDITNAADKDMLANMPDEKFQELLTKNISKKSGANGIIDTDMQEMDPTNKKPVKSSNVPEEIDEFVDDESFEKEDVPDLKKSDAKGPPQKEGMFGVKNFKQAMSFFGPRLVSLILGGSDAAEYTGELMDEYNEFTGGGMSAYQRARLAQADKRLQNQKEIQKGVTSRHKDRMERQDYKLNKPNAKMLGDVAANKAVLEHLDTLTKLGEKVPMDMRGPFKGRVNTLFTKLGIINDQDFSKFQTTSVALLNDYIKAQTGSQSGIKEQGRLAKIIPGPNDTYAEYMAKVAVLRDLVEGRLKSVDAVIEKYGFKGDNLTDDQKNKNAAILEEALSDELEKAIKGPDKDKEKENKYKAAMDKYNLK